MNLCGLHKIIVDCVSFGHLHGSQFVPQYQFFVYILTLVKNNQGIEHLLHRFLLSVWGMKWFFNVSKIIYLVVSFFLWIANYCESIGRETILL